jgi:hypothetical protein
MHHPPFGHPHLLDSKISETTYKTQLIQLYRFPPLLML